MQLLGQTRTLQALRTNVAKRKKKRKGKKIKSGGAILQQEGTLALLNTKITVMRPPLHTG
jgi:hypothetical protein